MRQILFLIILIAIFFSSCEPNPTETDHDWWFEIKVNGVPHRIEGQFNSCDYVNDWDYFNYGNKGYITNTGSIFASMTNKGESEYVIGESFNLSMPSQSQKLGTNYFTLFDSYSVDESFLGVHNYIDLSLSINAVSNGLNKNGFSLYPIDTSHGHVESKFPIYITQNASEHTPGSNNGCYDHIGNPIIGSGSSTIYVLDTIYETTPYAIVYSYTRPYFIEIDFKLYRPPY